MILYSYPTAIVNCPIEEEYDDLALRQFSVAKIGTQSCGGSLNIIHANEYDLGNFQHLLLAGDGGRNKRGSYPNLKRGFPVIKRNMVIRMETLGDCCWEIYAKRKFEGEQQYIHHGKHFPEIKPASVKKVPCRHYDY